MLIPQDSCEWQASAVMRHVDVSGKGVWHINNSVGFRLLEDGNWISYLVKCFLSFIEVLC